MISFLRRIYTSWFPILSILLLGSYLRLYRIADYLTFLGDEGRDVLVVKRMIVDGKWTLLGPTASVGGFYMGPIYYYFMLPFLWLWKLDPVGPAIMVALFGVVTIFLLYKFADEYFGRFVGLAASSLYAVSPVVIAYSRSSWNPNIVPFFSLMVAYKCMRLFEQRTACNAFWIGILLGIGVQLHYTFLFIFPVVFIWLLLYLRQNFIKYCLWCAAGFLVGFSPFLAFEFRHGFTNLRGIFGFITEGKDTGFALSHFLWNIKDIFFRIFGRLILRIPDGGIFDNLTQAQKNIWTMGVWIFALSSVVFPVLLYKYSVYSKRQKIVLQLVWLWLCTVLLMFGLYKKSIYDYYFGLFFVVPFILSALALSRIWAYNKIGKLIAGSIVFGILFFNWQGRPFIYEPNRQLNQAKIIAQAVLEQTNGMPFNFALITGGNSDHAYRYFFEIWNSAPITIENAVIDPDRKTVTDQLLIVCEDPNCEPLGHSLWEVSGFGRAEIAGVWNVSVVKVYKLVHYKEQK